MTPISTARGLLLLGLVVVGTALVAAKAPVDVAAPAAVAASAAPAAVGERVAPEPRGGPIVVAGTPSPTEAPAAATKEPTAPTQAPEAPAPPAAVIAPVPAAAAQVCPSTFFCYPRLGIAGPIIDYHDCSGATDVGAAIRVLTCVPEGIWLAGHAYTQFGRITDFRVGDAVFVNGKQFAISGSSFQRACAPTTQTVAPLSLQTSLDSAACGRVLVVEGR